MVFKKIEKGILSFSFLLFDLARAAGPPCFSLAWPGSLHSLSQPSSPPRPASAPSAASGLSLLSPLPRLGAGLFPLAKPKPKRRSSVLSLSLRLTRRAHLSAPSPTSSHRRAGLGRRRGIRLRLRYATPGMTRKPAPLINSAPALRRPHLTLKHQPPPSYCSSRHSPRQQLFDNYTEMHV